MQQIPLSLIDDNPFQDRGAYNEIDALGRAIALNGLEQLPRARQAGERYQLKFGHRRLRAFQWLQAHYKAEGLPDRYQGYTVMPLEVETISDREMFDGVVIENVHRDDLKVTEKARLLRRYKETHPEATSAQIGVVFNMNAATVRGFDIFLDLPDAVQAALDAGQISMATARLLHSVQKIAPDKFVVGLLKEIAIRAERRGDSPEVVIEDEVDDLDYVVALHNEKHRDGKPRARDRWLLDMKNFPNKLMPALTVEALGQYEAEAEHLANPPACTACKFYTKIRGTHFCGLKICFERKVVAWARQQLEAASKTTGIPLYNPEDGAMVPLHSYGKDEALFKKGHPGLRLVAKEAVRGYVHQGFKGVDDDYAIVVATGEAINKLESNSGHTTRVGKKSEKEKAEMRAMKLYRQRRLELLWEFSGVAQSLFESVSLPAIKELCTWRHVGVDDRIPEEYAQGSRADAQAQLSYQRRSLVWRLAVEHSNYYHREPLEKSLARMADALQVKTLKALTQRVQAWDAEIKGVATATGAQ